MGSQFLPRNINLSRMGPPGKLKAKCRFLNSRPKILWKPSILNLGLKFHPRWIYSLRAGKVSTGWGLWKCRWKKCFLAVQIPKIWGHPVNLLLPPNLLGASLHWQGKFFGDGPKNGLHGEYGPGGMSAEQKLPPKNFAKNTKNGLKNAKKEDRKFDPTRVWKVFSTAPIQAA